jgi:phytoene/squalene synthetase
MDLAQAFANCEEVVRNHDPDRYFAALFAPAQRRALLFALYAFNFEIAKVGETVSEPMLGEIRLQWWREAAAAARDLHRRPHDVAQALVEVFAAVGPPLELFEAAIDARGFDVRPETFADLAALEAYGDATSGNLMRLAALALDEEHPHDELAREAGIAYALAGTLRAIPFHAARGRVYLPLDLLRAEGLSPEDVLAGRACAKLKAAIGRVADRARAHLAAARKLHQPKAALAAFLPATLVPLYLNAVTKPSFDPFRQRVEPALFRRQFALLSASFRGTI